MDSIDPSHGTPYRSRTNNSASARRTSMADNNSTAMPQRSTASSLLRASPYSPFPFGLPIQSSSRSILSPGSVEQKLVENEEIAARNSFPNDNINNHTSPHVLRGRVRAQDVYGGPLMFGGTRAYSSSRGAAIPSSGKNRNQRLLLSASPYHCAAASRIAGKQLGRPRPSNSSSTTPSPSGSSTSSAPGGLSNNASQTTHVLGHNRPSNTSPSHALQTSPHFLVDPNSSNSSCYSRPSSSLASNSAKVANVNAADPACISSTARLILDTLDKMSTPIRDAQKLSSVLSNNSMPHDAIGQNINNRSSRAERRKLIAEALDASSVSMNLSNSSLSMQDDLMSNDKCGRAKRRRPNLGAPINGNASTTNRFRANHSNFNGPPLRSLAFSPVSKDKASAQTTLKSARIQNLSETNSNNTSSPSCSTSTNNANISKNASQLLNPDSRIETKAFATNQSKPFLSESSNSTLLTSFNKQEPNNTSVFSNRKNIHDVVSNTPVSAISAKQGGKMKTKISSGLEQVRAQRSGVNSNYELSVESSSNENQLQNTKSLSMFLKSDGSDKEKNNKLPNINFTIPSNVTPLEKKNLDVSLPINPLRAESSQNQLDEKKNLANKLGVFQSPLSIPSPISLSTGSASVRNPVTTGNEVPSDTNVTASKSNMSTETAKIFSNSPITKKFSFTPVSDLKQSTISTNKDDTITSTRKFTFHSPKLRDDLHSDIDKES